MNQLPDLIQGWCAQGNLPTADVFYDAFTGDDHLFLPDEGPFWDFKDAWPFSLSDSYFGGIARLICGFKNAHGGVIVFGVHDKSRSGGHNRVKINLDKFQLALRQLFGSEQSIHYKHYASDLLGDTDVLLIPERPIGSPPVRFRQTVGQYLKDILWVRNGHEVVRASPRDFPVLFCRAENEILEGATDELEGSLPSSPATIKKFIGRVTVLDHLFTWLQNSDEPRTYLHGKGGSGKSTIAFEFARLLKDHGARLRTCGGDQVDTVIYLSAKETQLVTAAGPDVVPLEPDFSTEAELYRHILFYARWIIDRSVLSALSIETLKREVAELFDYSTIVLVVDDIDTLTTRGVDPGSEYLFRVLCRAAKRSKVVYTLRNAPTQSLGNSIEVPGLGGDDYRTFVRECALQFVVQEPSPDFRDGKLVQISEARPLVIESVVALVRTTGSYKRAAEAFEEHAGEGVRDYVFLREWNHIPSDGPGRLLLAALADLNQPIGFSDLETVLRNDPSRIRDAIGAVREMFLTVDQAGEEALFSLAPLTRKFVNSKKAALVGYNILKERVRAFTRNVHISSPEVARKVVQVERLLRDSGHLPERWSDAWKIVHNPALPPNVTEDPLFRSLIGYVAASGTPARLTEAREAFQYATQMGFEPDFRYLLAWFNAEKFSGAYDGSCERVAEIVVSGRSYSEKEKVEMIARRATHQYIRGRDLLRTDFSDGIALIEEALRLHLKAFRLNCLRGSSWAEQSEKYARNTFFVLFNSWVRQGTVWEALKLLQRLSDQKDVYLDPLVDPIKDLAREMLSIGVRPEILNRLRQHLRGLPEALSRPGLWLELGLGSEAIDLIKNADKTIADRLRSREARGERSTAGDRHG